MIAPSREAGARLQRGGFQEARGLAESECLGTLHRSHTQDDSCQRLCVAQESDFHSRPVHPGKYRGGEEKNERERVWAVWWWGGGGGGGGGGWGGFRARRRSYIGK